MDMIVNSLYSNREVFLRELVSNASDALDKARFNAITDGRDAGELRIRVRGDADARTIVIEDSGVGMSREEMLSSLGTIARSGTAKFAEAVKEANGDASLIGQFGVGFYSAFLVADRVTVASRSSAGDADGKIWQWESSAGSHSYSVKELDGDALKSQSSADGSGDGIPTSGGFTRVTLHLKDDAAELADPAKLSALLKQYSEFIQFPIELWASRTVYDDVEDEEATKKAQEAADAAAKAEDPPREKADPVKPVMTSKPRAEFAWTRQNDSAPLWTRSPKEVEKSEYNAFFKTSFKEFLDPLAHAHFSVEGTIEFTALLYVPSMAPFEQQDWLKPSRNVKLFVKRVFISDEFDEDLLPRWASFVRGVVDSADLPLNVSREILQESRVVRTIRRQLVKRTIEMLKVREDFFFLFVFSFFRLRDKSGRKKRKPPSLEKQKTSHPQHRKSPPAPPAPTRTPQPTTSSVATRLPEPGPTTTRSGPRSGSSSSSERSKTPRTRRRWRRCCALRRRIPPPPILLPLPQTTKMRTLLRLWSPSTTTSRG